MRSIDGVRLPPPPPKPAPRPAPKPAPRPAPKAAPKPAPKPAPRPVSKHVATNAAVVKHVAEAKAAHGHATSAVGNAHAAKAGFSNAAKDFKKGDIFGGLKSALGGLKAAKGLKGDLKDLKGDAKKVAGSKAVKALKGKIPKRLKSAAGKLKVPAGLKKRAAAVKARAKAVAAKLKSKHAVPTTPKGTGKTGRTQKVIQLARDPRARAEVKAHAAKGLSLFNNLKGVLSGAQGTRDGATQTWSDIVHGHLIAAAKDGFHTVQSAKGTIASAKGAVEDGKWLAKSKGARAAMSFLDKKAPGVAAKLRGAGSAASKVAGRAGELGGKAGQVARAAAEKLPGKQLAGRLAGRANSVAGRVGNGLNKLANRAGLPGEGAGLEGEAASIGAGAAERGGAGLLLDGAARFAGPVGVAYTGWQVGWATGRFAGTHAKWGGKTLDQHTASVMDDVFFPKLKKQEAELKKADEQDDKENKFIKDHGAEIKAGTATDPYNMHARATKAMEDAGLGGKVLDGDSRKKFVKDLHDHGKWPPPPVDPKFHDSILKPPVFGPPAPKPAAPAKPAPKKH